MSTVPRSATSQMAILRRIVEANQDVLSETAARALLRLDFSQSDRERMDKLAAKNREGRISAAEDDELESYIQVGQTLAILKSKARQALKSRKATRERRSNA